MNQQGQQDVSSFCHQWSGIYTCTSLLLFKFKIFINLVFISNNARNGLGNINFYSGTIKYCFTGNSNNKKLQFCFGF